MIQVNCVAQVSLSATWLRFQQNMVHSPFKHTYREEIGGFNTKKRYPPAASIVQGLHQGLMCILDHLHSSSLTYWPCFTCLIHGKSPFNAWYSILDNEQTLQLRQNISNSGLKLSIRTCSHPANHCMSPWRLMSFASLWHSTTNYMNCLFVTLKRCNWNCNCTGQNVFCMADTTKILIVVNVFFEVDKSRVTPCNLIQ